MSLPPQASVRQEAPADCGGPWRSTNPFIHRFVVLASKRRMLVLAGGRERTIDDYAALAASAGLQVTATHRTTERYVIIECVRRN